MWKINETYNWEDLEKRFSWIRDMNGVPQSPYHHAEGDVAIHTRAVLQALQGLEEYQQLPEQEQHILSAAALMHDIEKRSTTTVEYGEIISPGHAKKGEYTTRSLLYREHAAPFEIREQVAKLVRLHGLPLWALEKGDPNKAVIEASLQLNTHHLYLLAKADVLGRICQDAQELLYRLEYYKELCIENECWGKQRKFESGLAQYHYFHSETPSLGYVPFDDRKSEVIILSALPGSGKDTFISQYYSDWPVVSLDDLRRSHKISPTDKKGNGKVIQMAKEEARTYLRKGDRFVWNATNITRQMREQLISLFDDYKARVTIVYLEVPYQKLLGRNQKRQHKLPVTVLEKMIGKLEIPTLSEAHEVVFKVVS